MRRSRWWVMCAGLSLLLAGLGVIAEPAARAGGSRAPGPSDGEAARRRVRAEAQAALKARRRDPSRLELLAVADPGDGPVQSWLLANGLRVLIAPDPLATTVAFHARIGAGSAAEPPDVGGVAHLLEHLMFKGSAAFPPGALDRLIERHGGSPDAETWLDYTAYYETVPPSGLADVLRVEADRLLRPDLSEGAVRAELGVVASERREALVDDPDGAIDELLYKMAYGAHPYGRPTLGSAASIARLDRAAVRRFHRRHYAPASTVIAIAGAVDPAATIARVVELYQSPTESTVSAFELAPLPELVLDGPGAATVTIDAGAPRLVRAWLTSPRSWRDRAALTVLAELLAGGRATRLYRALVRAGLASEVQAEVPLVRGPPLFELRVWLQPGARPAAVRGAIDRVLAGLRGPEPPTAAEVAAARSRLQTAHCAELATQQGRATMLAEGLSSFGDPFALHRWRREIEGMEAGTVARAVRRQLLAGRRFEIEARTRGPR